LTLIIEHLLARHHKKNFDCGEDLLNRYLVQFAGQDVRRNVARVFVVTEKDKNDICGFYSFSGTVVEPEKIPSARLPAHSVPCVLLGRLAVDSASQGKGLGTILVVDAIQRFKKIAEHVGMHALIVDALNDDLFAFYETFGFQKMDITKRRLFLPLASL
jgi:ribosomal protein S18 acetylase RimI-like enzyme